MLLQLRIANLALIEQAELDTGPGLNILTGETGAGKSILVLALALLLGERAASEQVGQAPGGKAVVEGLFDLTDAPAVRTFLEANELADGNPELSIVREVLAEGRSRVRVNGHLGTAGLLRELANLLVDLHGQHEHQCLLQSSSHLEFLDACGAAPHHKLLREVQEAWALWHAALARRQELQQDESTRAQRLDLLTFQMQEIDEAALLPDEEDTLKEDRHRLQNVEHLRARAELCHDLLAGEDTPGALGLTQQAHKAAQQLQQDDPSVGEWLAALEQATANLQEVALEARHYLGSLEADPTRLEAMEARLHIISRLTKKYGDVLAHREAIGAEFERLSAHEASLEEINGEVEAATAAYRKVAGALSKSRHRLQQTFEPAVQEQLRSLAMDHARFALRLEAAEPGPNGADDGEFLFSANPGQPLKPLARIASGGEISRVMLALHTVRAAGGGDSGTVPRVLIFDEIDVGIGGVTADSIGRKMKELAGSFQVFCVTHLPQLARYADRHYRVRKTAESEATTVTVDVLQGEARVHELARMLGHQEGDASDIALLHARKLLAG